ncbi:hypothetical protein [Caulobacter sp. NIBR1757]|uniref:hypothetical protein n=1 Tax=Caulobacter sp. NIBR1757 TaxID=3016000 RepID=UPI0022F079B6|nr:hypothetical protein [Caulobacter sp. NIBR1757]WGM38743.1 hypothetical protein AMEJIAPC_01648 [Caulobacter sp. NIBR1757]
MRAALLLPLVLLGACATQPDANPGSYTLGRGLVTYDELKRAKDKCVAAGGVVRPYTDGGDQYQLSNYQCVIAPKEKAQ